MATVLLTLVSTTPIGRVLIVQIASQRRVSNLYTFNKTCFKHRHFRDSIDSDANASTQTPKQILSVAARRRLARYGYFDGFLASLNGRCR
jgi:hypothetical protein